MTYNKKTLISFQNVRITEPIKIPIDFIFKLALLDSNVAIKRANGSEPSQPKATLIEKVSPKITDSI